MRFFYLFRVFIPVDGHYLKVNSRFNFRDIILYTAFRAYFRTNVHSTQTCHQIQRYIKTYDDTDSEKKYLRSDLMTNFEDI